MSVSLGRGLGNAETNRDRRWWILGVLAMAQLMVILDGTIVNIALPEAQQSLGFGDGQRQWVVTAYSLAFGSLLLLGGRINDLFGRKRSFVIGLIGFAAASAVGGWGPSFEVLVAARALQGVFGALLAPAALSLLSVTFADSKDRTKAFGAFGAISGAGGAIGLLLGGVLTEYVSWHWCLYVNVVFAVFALAGAVVLLPKQHSSGMKASLDIKGVSLATAGLFALVFGFANSESNGWSNPMTLAFLLAGVVLLTMFAWVETVVRNPLLPMRIVADRLRGTSYLVMLIATIGMFGIFLFLTYYLQQTLGYSPVVTGVAFLPMVGTIAVSASISGSVLATRYSPKILVSIGMAVSAVGIGSLTTIASDTSYLAGVLPGLVAVGAGLGFVFSSAMAASTAGVHPTEVGIASATVNTSQQVGASIGVALLSSIATMASNHYTANANDGTASVADGAALASYHAAFLVTAVLFAVGAIISVILYKNEVIEHSTDSPVLAH